MNIRKNIEYLKSKENSTNGVTLISLVITIILLIILAGASISMVVGDSSIFNIAKKQQEQMKITQITERLELEKANIYTDTLGIIDLDKYIEKIQKNDNKVGEYKVTSIEKVENGKAKIVVDDKYQYLLEEEENGNVKITYEGEIGNLPPKIENVEIENTTNSISVKVTGKRIEKYIYYIKEKNSEEEYKERGNNETGEYTFTGLKENTEYSIKVEVTNKTGKKDSREINRTTSEMVNLSAKEVIYTKTETNWTNKNVTTTITLNTDKNVEGYKIEYITFGIDEEVTSEKLTKGVWREYSATGIISIQNEKIYSRLNDGYNTTSYTSTQISNIDKQDPEINTALSSNNVTTKGFTLSVGITDTLSGYSKIIWNYKKSSDTKYTSEEEVTTQMNGTTAGAKTQVIKTKVYDNLISGTYNAYVEVYDVAGNKETSETIDITLEGIEVPQKATANPTGWTNGDVVVTLPTKSGFTTEYQIGTLNVNGTWTSGNTTSVSSNTTIYYRYNDGKNAGGYGTHTISNIDKQKPSVVTITYNGRNDINYDSCSWKYDYNLTLSADGTGSGIAYYEIDTDWSETTIEATTGSNWIPGNGFSSCATRFRAVDEAGNRGPWSEAQHIHMDTEAPGKTSVNLNGYVSGTWTESDVVQTFSAYDNIGIAYYQYSYDKVNVAGDVSSSWTIGSNGQWNLYVRAVDHAGLPGEWSDMYTIKRAPIVAKIGNLGYPNIQTAVNEGNNCTITLIVNTIESVEVPSSKTINLDLNGKTLTIPSGKTFSNNGNITIYNGTIYKVGIQINDILLINRGRMTIKSGSYIMDLANGNSCWTSVIWAPSGELEILGGNLCNNHSLDGGTIVANSGKIAIGRTIDGRSENIGDINITSNYVCIWADGDPDIEIASGNISSPWTVIDIRGGTTKIIGGTLRAYGYDFNKDASAIVLSGGKIGLYGGTIQGVAWGVYAPEGGLVYYNGSNVISDNKLSGTNSSPMYAPDRLYMWQKMP